MTASRIRKRIKKLAAKLCPTSDRSYTLEDLCRLMWWRHKARFLAMADGECRFLRVFVPAFEHDDAERSVHARGGK